MRSNDFGPKVIVVCPEYQYEFEFVVRLRVYKTFVICTKCTKFLQISITSAVLRKLEVFKTPKVTGELSIKKTEGSKNDF